MIKRFLMVIFAVPLPTCLSEINFEGPWNTIWKKKKFSWYSSIKCQIILKFEQADYNIILLSKFTPFLTIVIFIVSLQELTVRPLWSPWPPVSSPLRNSEIENSLLSDTNVVIFMYNCRSWQEFCLLRSPWPPVSSPHRSGVEWEQPSLSVLMLYQGIKRLVSLFSNERNENQ